MCTVERDSTCAFLENRAAKIELLYVPSKLATFHNLVLEARLGLTVEYFCCFYRRLCSLSRLRVPAVQAEHVCGIAVHVHHSTEQPVPLQ